TPRRDPRRRRVRRRLPGIHPTVGVQTSHTSRLLPHDGRCERQAARLVLPLHVRFTFDDKSTQNFDYPAEIWSTNTTFYVRSYAFTGKKMTKVELDPDKKSVDIDRENNVWPRAKGP